MRENVPFEIREHIATLAEYSGGEYTLELNHISYKGAAPKYDLRKWDKKAGRMLKGVTLTPAEAEACAAAILAHLRKEARP